MFDTCLPHQSTIGKWYQNIDAKPGFTTECLETLKQHLQSSPRPTVCSLIVDEIAIRKHLEWDGRKFHGYVDFGVDFDDDATSLAKEAFVLLVVGINGTWKIPIGYFFTDGLSGLQKASIISQAVSLIAETGAQVKALTCDGVASNVTMGTVLGCNFHYPNIGTSFLVASQKMYFFFDPSHVIKLVRNALAENQSLVDDEGNCIQWKYVSLLHEL